MAMGFVRGALVSAAIAAMYLTIAPAQAGTTTWNTTSNLNPTTSTPTQPSTCNTQTAAGAGTTFCLTSAANNPNFNNLQNQGLASTSGGNPQVVYGNQFTFT